MIDIKATRTGARDEGIMFRASRIVQTTAWSLAAVTVILATPSRSYQTGLPWLGAPLNGPTLTPDDVARMQAAVARLNEGRSIGTVERWRGQSSKNAGEVALTRRFVAKGMSCHTLRYVIRYNSRPNAPRHFVFNWCRQPGGEWKIVELDS
ncbi:MAG TPA: hypothetical protein VGG92_04655 [Caulobacteraceae bacterium]|jgi:surface antigen